MKTLKIAGKNFAFMLGMLIMVFLSLTSFRNSNIQNNNDPLSAWDKDILRQANSASAVPYLSDEEKKLIFFTNLCRLQPKLFCTTTVLADYLKTHPNNTSFMANLKKQLMQSKSIVALVPDKELCTMAHDFAKKMGQEGKEGHPDFQKRMQPVMSRYHRVGENCDYGDTTAISAFMNLLIDTSDPVSLGHRKNLLDPNFTSIGVSRQPHKTYRWNFVMDFGG